MTIQYEGGYFLLPEPLVRGYGPNGHTANDMSNLSRYTVEAVNLIQDTPWQINGWVHDVIMGLVEEGLNITNSEEEMVLRLEEPQDPRKFDPRIGQVHSLFQSMDPETWQGLSPKTKKEFKGRRAKMIKEFEEQLGVYRATKRVLSTAAEMKQFDKFYFPHNLDFRTRIYPIPTDLNPQSNDLSKGLLRFARPTQLGKEGLFWLGFTVAGQWGKDKLSPQERFDHAKEMLSIGLIQQWVDDPLTHRGWLDADAPFQFLAVAHEWVWAHRQGKPEHFFSHLPCNLDGSCNGAQHLSMMTRDLKGATATNCRSKAATGGKRHDLYGLVGDKVWEAIQRDASEGHPCALDWIKKLDTPEKRRKAVKRAVMTVPYGVTEFGVAEFIMKETMDDSIENQWDAAKYLRDLIWSSIDATLDRGRQLQRYFSTCATICAKAGKPLQWDTPAGSKVTQAYRNVIQKRVKAFDTRFYIYEEPRADEDGDEFLDRIGMDEKKMATAAPPNVVHSCDASHLQVTVVRMGHIGIRDFSMIHDSFGCPMAQAGLMRDILRKTAVDMYAGNYLLQWKESVERYSGLKMPNPTFEMGEFDINEILESEFFFS